MKYLNPPDLFWKDTLDGQKYLKKLGLSEEGKIPEFNKSNQEKTIEEFYFGGQLTIVNKLEKTIYTEIRKPTTRMHKHVLEVGIAEWITKKVQETKYELQIYLLENNKTYTFTADELENFLGHNTIFLARGVRLVILPLLLLHEVEPK